MKNKNSALEALFIFHKAQGTRHKAQVGSDKLEFKLLAVS